MADRGAPLGWQHIHAHFAGGAAEWTWLVAAVLSVPYMVRCNVRMHEAVGTAASIGFPIAIAGTAGYLISGWGRELPPGSLGFIYLPAALFIVAASVFTAPLGARAAHKLSGTTLKRAFAIILAALATKMLWDLLRF